jgi:hypothetical protein
MDGGASCGFFGVSFNLPRNGRSENSGHGHDHDRRDHGQHEVKGGDARRRQGRLEHQLLGDETEQRRHTGQ